MNTLRDLAALAALCALSYLPGLNAVGLVNWQESARALAAREMQASGRWIVPTIAGEPYLAKPPMLYWCELVLCKATGMTAGEAPLRWTVALAGLAGVLMVYLAARSVLARGIDRAQTEPPGLDRSAALWAGAFVATGVMYVRSARVGELDILLAPFTTLAVWGTAWAWLNPTAAWWRRAAAIVGAAAGCAGAALTKGPPGIMAIGLAGGGGIMLATAWAREGARARPRLAAALAVMGMIAGAGSCAWMARTELGSVRTWMGIVLMGVCGAGLAASAPLLAAAGVGPAVARAWWRGGIAPVLAAGAGALWWWTRAVEARIGAEAIARTIGQETSDNLRVLSPEAPLQNLEAIAYGVGLGSAAMIAALVWLVTKRPRLSGSWWVILAWIGLGLIAFSLLGRGTGRYLTPLWPAVGILGGVWMARAVRDFPSGRALARWGVAGVLALGAGQSAWYAWWRAGAEGLRSPRDFLAELLAPEHGVDAARIASVDFWIGSLDFYTGCHVEPVTAQGPWVDYPHAETPLASFIERARRDGGTYTLLVRATPAPTDVAGSVPGSPAPIEAIRSAGLEAQEIPLRARFLIDRQRTAIKAVRVRFRG